MPGQAEKAARFLGLEPREFFHRYLMVDFWGKSDEMDRDIFVLAPAVVGQEPGREYPANPEGACVFYQKGKCRIHAVKPFECLMTFHTDGKAQSHKRHRKIAEAWAGHQAQIRAFLGRKPELPDSFEMLGWLLDKILPRHWPETRKSGDGK